MQFYLTDVQILISCAEHHQIDNLHIQNNTFQLTVNKVHRVVNNSSISKVINQTTVSKTITDNTKNKVKAPQYRPNTHNHTNRGKTQDYFTIVAPMTGTFFRSPAPQAPYFIKINERINNGQVIGIIEAMKLMNEIESEFGGKIVEILVKDGGMVKCGQALMKIKRT